MGYCKIRTSGMWNFFGGCNRSISKTFLSPQICRASASIVLSVVYDRPMVSSTDDLTVIKVNRFAEIAVNYAQPGNYLVEFFPWMKYIPSSVASWKRLAEERHEEYSDMYVGLFREVEHRIVITFLHYSLPPRSPIV